MATQLLPLASGQSVAWRAGDRSAPAETIIGEGSSFARLPRIGDADEAVLGVPGTIARPVGEQIAIGVIAQRLAR